MTIVPFFDYKLRIANAAGVHQAEIYGRGDADQAGVRGPFLDLAYTNVVNGAGLCTFTLPADHEAVEVLEDRGRVEVWRRNRYLDPPVPWYCDWRGLLRAEDWTYTDRENLQVKARGILGVLGWRELLWYAGTAARTAFTSTPAETIAKSLVQYNATVDATVVNGRLREGVISGFPIVLEADAGQGTVRDWYCAWDNLLKSLQGLAAVGGGDFDLVALDNGSWQFRWYEGQLGSDRTGEVHFSVAFGNMVEPHYWWNALGEKTVAVALGQNTKSSRAYQIVTSDDYSAANDIELVVPAPDVETAAGLQARGYTALEKVKRDEGFRFKVRQTPACLYGQHYFLGDRCGATHRDFDGPVKLKNVAIGLARDGTETVDVYAEAV